jgi:hypothetical protein
MITRKVTAEMQFCAFLPFLLMPAHLPEHLAQHAQPEFGIGGG